MDWHVSRVVGHRDGKPVVYKEGSCDSSETKPTSGDNEYFADGSIIFESDSGAVTAFNAKTSSWIPQFSFQG